MALSILTQPEQEEADQVLLSTTTLFVFYPLPAAAAADTWRGGNGEGERSGGSFEPEEEVEWLFEEEEMREEVIGEEAEDR